MAADLLARLLRLLADVNHEIADALADPDGRARLMAGVGRVPAGAAPAGSPNAAMTLAALRDRMDGPDPNALEALRDFSTAMVELVSLVQQVALADSEDDAWNLLASWIDLVTIDRMRVRHLDLLAALRALHLVADNRLLIGDLVRARDDWGSFVLGRPADDDARADNWSIIIGALLAVLGKWIPPEDESGKAWRTDLLFGWDPDPGGATPRAERALQRMATVHFTHRHGVGDAAVEERSGFSVAVVPPSTGGWGLFFALELGAGLKFPIGKHLRLAFQADSPSAVHAFFGKSPFVRSGASDTTARITLSRKQEQAEQWTIGKDSGVHFEVGRFSTGLELADPMRFRFSLGDAALVLPRQALGFLGSALPSGGAKFAFDIDLGIDTRGKLSFAGGAGLAVTLPVNAALAVLKVRSVTLALSLEQGPHGAAGALSAVVAFGLDFGSAFRVAVDGIGAKLRWTLPPSPENGAGPPAPRGNLGPAGDLALGFVPPRGIGVLIDIGPIKGGGYFYLDPERRTYAGVLEASLALCGQGLQIKAAGLLRETDDGWDFMLILSAQFEPPIEIFLGLTLNGVGGMVGVNVAVDVDRLRAGLRDGAMGRLLFPEDPVANAPGIIATMVAVFPHRKGGLVAGPMLQIAWGRPTSFVTLSVAVVLAMPSPALLLIMGRLRIAAPHADLAAVDMKADFLGVVDFEQPALSFDASLTDSRLTMFPLTGDLAMRAGAKGFVLSVGGLHPRFPPPADLGAMRRIAIDISPNAITKIRCEAYLAVTSNTFQLGLHARLDIDAKVFTIHGWMDFDALVQWEPRFRFLVQFAAGMELRVGGRCLAGVSVDLLLEGPGLWHAKGRASIHFLFFTVSGGFEVTWGERGDDAPVPEIDAVDRVAQALSAPGAWSSIAPQGEAIATFRTEGREALGVHPDGQLSVRQQAVPLGIPITRIGRSRVAGGSAVVTLAPVEGAPPAAPTLGQFAASQFIDLSDDEKLSRPSFEPCEDGISFGAAGLQLSAVQSTPGTYETVFVPERRPRIRGLLALRLLDDALELNSVARSGLHFAQLHDGPRRPVTVTDPSWRIVAADTLAPLVDAPQAFGSAAAAQAAARALGGLRVLVVGTHEALQ